MIRDANFTDIPAIAGLLADRYRLTHYAKDGTADIDIAEAKRLLVASLHRHGHKNGGGTWVQVSETNGMITGLILGTLQRVYAIGNKLMATDLFWVVNGNADPMDAIRLMQSMIAWAKSSPHCIEVHCGTTAIINDNPEDAGKILDRLGLKKYGTIHRMGF